MKLIVGRIPFLVCAPYFHTTLEQPPQGVVFQDGTPSQQNKSLREGLIHLAPSSSFAYGQNPELFSILPELCTGSTLEIRSVKLFSKVPWKDLNGQFIHLTPQSSTSTHLLKLISWQCWQIQPQWETSSWDPKKCTARLLIGDEALLESTRNQWPYSYDLASVWQEWQGLPFVFGIWIVHKSAWEDSQRKVILDQYRAILSQSVRAFRTSPNLALDHWLKAYPSRLPRDFLMQYFQVVDYGFSDAQKESLERFLALCSQAGLISGIPALRFL